MAEGHDNSRGAAGKDLADPTRLDVCEQRPQADGVLHNAPAGVAQQTDDRAAGGAFQDRPSQARGAHSPVSIDDHDVHAAELFKVPL